MFPRTLAPPRNAFFLFGPRGTGKSTWLRNSLEEPWVLNLLPAETNLRYGRMPGLLRAEVLTQPKTRWLVIDEVQRVPALLDEVHFLMEEHGYKKFCLTGSSARKLKRGAANLLAGRAIVKNLFPLTTRELGGSVPMTQLMRFGTLPLSVNAPNAAAREEFLKAYVTTYLTEEIRAEALVRNLGSFSRFIAIAAMAAGQTTNVSNIARDAQVSRETARGYFDVLVDTLIGTWLPAYRPRAKIKEVAAPKFYWFDCGVLTAAAGGFEQPLPGDWNGVLLEHLIFHELTAFMHYSGTKGSLGYWATPSGSEIDFVWWYGNRRVAIEVKHSTQWRAEYRKAIASLESSERIESYVVYRGDRELSIDGTHVLPVEKFLTRLHAGAVLR
jgi:predicted AAA+ superfamily ATPase